MAAARSPETVRFHDLRSQEQGKPATLAPADLEPRAIVVGRRDQFNFNDCRRPRDAVCELAGRKNVILVEAGREMDVNELLSSWYGTSILPDFNGSAAAVTFFVLLAIGVGVLLVPLLRQQQPQYVTVDTTPRPPPNNPLPHQPPRTTQPAGRADTSGLQQLVNEAEGRAVARTRVSRGGGYVAVWDAVVWAVMHPQENSTAAPGDELALVGLDEGNGALVVAPIGSTVPKRGTRP